MTHDDERIWAIVAFARTLLGMSGDVSAQATGPADASSKTITFLMNSCIIRAASTEMRTSTIHSHEESE